MNAWHKARAECRDGRFWSQHRNSLARRTGPSLAVSPWRPREQALSLNQERLIERIRQADKHTIRQRVELRPERALRPIGVNTICMEHVVDQLRGHALRLKCPRIPRGPGGAELVVPGSQAFGTWPVTRRERSGFVQSVPASDESASELPEQAYTRCVNHFKTRGLCILAALCTHWRGLPVPPGIVNVHFYWLVKPQMQAEISVHEPLSPVV